MRIDASPNLACASLFLRPLDLSDVSAWYQYLSLRLAVEHTSWNVKSTEDLRTSLEWYNSDDPSSAIRFAICSESDDALIGTIGFHTISTVNRTSEIAYDLHPAYWGRGIASTACRSVVAWGFENREYVRIQGATLETNVRSVRVLQKCGFSLEGTLRNYRMVRGEPRNFLLYSTLTVHELE